MTIEKIFIDLELINDKTEIWILNSDMRVLAHGNWYQDDILEYTHCEVESFTWQNDNKIYIDVLKNTAAG